MRNRGGGKKEEGGGFRVHFRAQVGGWRVAMTNTHSDMLTDPMPSTDTAAYVLRRSHIGRRGLRRLVVVHTPQPIPNPRCACAVPTRAASLGLRCISGAIARYRYALWGRLARYGVCS
eukprot:2470219-Rhodomonas_salina.2